jgi:RNA polymerase-binding transcription factor DksA
MIQNARMKNSRPIDPRWHWHYHTLLAIRRKLVASRTEHRTNAAAAAAESDGIVSADQASDRMEREVVLAELDAEEGELEAIDAALQRIHGGTYGVCVRTGRPISAERLRAIPWTPYCQAAARRLEPKPSAGVRRNPPGGEHIS